MPITEETLRAGVTRDDHLDRSLVRGLAWTGAVKWGSQLLSWISTIVVARILNPEDYGLVAMAGVFLGFIGVMNEFGLGTAVVVLRHLSEAQIRRLHGLACCLGVATFVAACAIAIPAGQFFRSPDLPLVMAAAGTGFVLSGWRSVPGALLEKELRFKFLAFLDGGQAILTTIVTVAIAWWGAGYWALVLGGLVGNAGGTAVLLICRSVRPAWPSVESLREAVQLSSHVLVNRLSWHIASSSDVFVGGRMLGQGIIGAYSFSSTIASMPMEKVTSLVSRVMPAFYSSVQSDPAAVRRYLLLLTEAVSLITFPVALGMALEADDFVRLVFGEKWVNAIAPLQILAAWAAVRSVIGLVAPVTYVTGGSRIAMLNGLLCVALFPIGFFVGSHWGAVGLAWVWVFVQPVAFIQLYKHVLRVTGLSFLEYLQPLRPALSGVVVMVIGIMGFRYSLSSEWPMAFRLTAESLIGASFYGASMFAFHRDRLRQLFVMIKKSRQ